MQTSADIWIVDDVQSNRALFAEIVETLGHSAKTFPDGESAIEAASKETPDMILLDVMMPGLNGFESCRELRKQFDQEMVPIVMITANPDREMYSRGLEAGADDYLFQPIDLAAIRSRISAMLRLRAAYQDLSTTKEKLATRVDLLRREVAEAEQLLHLNDRLQSVGMMVAGIAHELRNPLTAVRFNLEWVADNLHKQETGLGPTWREQLSEAVDISLEATSNLDALVADLSTFARPDREDNQNSQVAAVVDSALRVTKHTVISHARLEIDVDRQIVAAVRPRRLAQVIINLIVNSARAIAKTKKRGVLRIQASSDGTWVQISVTDSGIGLPPNTDNIFEPFYTTDEGSGGTGLGLGICAQIVRRAGGEIACGEGNLGGAEIRLRIPQAHGAPSSSKTNPEANKIVLAKGSLSA